MILQAYYNKSPIYPIFYLFKAIFYILKGEYKPYIWLWVYANENPIYPIFYILKGDYKPHI